MISCNLFNRQTNKLLTNINPKKATGADKIPPKVIFFLPGFSSMTIQRPVEEGRGQPLLLSTTSNPFTTTQKFIWNFAYEMPTAYF